MKTDVELFIISFILFPIHKDNTVYYSDRFSLLYFPPLFTLFPVCIPRKQYIAILQWFISHFPSFTPLFFIVMPISSSLSFSSASSSPSSSSLLSLWTSSQYTNQFLKYPGQRWWRTLKTWTVVLKQHRSANFNLMKELLTGTRCKKWECKCSSGF